MQVQCQSEIPIHALGKSDRNISIFYHETHIEQITEIQDDKLMKDVFEKVLR